MNLKHKKILVIGAGDSGVSAAKFLQERGAVVGIYDDKGEASIPQAILVKDEESVRREQFDFAVISPGVSINHKIARVFEGRLVGEVALGFTVSHKKIVAITGTNGKTTTTKMLAKALGKNGIAVGNIGIPVTSVTREIGRRTAVCEVSSFMLEGGAGFRPNISMILNITQDHLERHGTMDEYVRCKSAISEMQTNRDYLILNYDCEQCKKIALANDCKPLPTNAPQVLFFSTTAAVRGIYIADGKVVLNIGRRPKILFDIKEFGEQKPHQIQNILAVTLAAVLLGVRKKAIIKACSGVVSHEHRIQHVRTMGSVSFYNDSKATNIAATLAAVRSMSVDINLILGGVAKGQNFDTLFESLPKHVQHIFCFGESSSDIIASAQKANFEQITQCRHLSEAVNRAIATGSGPRVVLLSPACSSFDMFKSYADRGEKFMQIVNALKEVGEREVASAEQNPVDEG
jgi:UDP-N-acetylmuramoylalanine--D-glutamate ligase